MVNLETRPISTVVVHLWHLIMGFRMEFSLPVAPPDRAPEAEGVVMCPHDRKVDR